MSLLRQFIKEGMSHKDVPFDFRSKMAGAKDKSHLALLRKIAKDDRLNPNKRFLAVLLLMYKEDALPLSFLMDLYIDAGRIKRAEAAEDKEEQQRNDKIDREAKEELRKLFEEEVVNATSDDTTNNG